MFFSHKALKDHYKAQKRMAEILNEATMTNQPMSERERATKEALEMALKCFTGAVYGSTYHVETQSKIKAALRAYDPKPEKEYTMPEWDDFVRVNSSITGGKAEEGKPYETWGWVLEEKITKTTYNAIREALSKPKAPTE